MTRAEWNPSHPFLDDSQAEPHLHASDASWGCESALPFLWDEPAAGLGQDLPGTPPCPRSDVF